MPEDDFGIKLKASKKQENRNVLLNTMSPLYYCALQCYKCCFSNVVA